MGALPRRRLAPCPLLLPLLLVALSLLALVACGSEDPPDGDASDTSGPPDTSADVEVPPDYVPIEVMDDQFVVFHHLDFVNPGDTTAETTVLEDGGHLPVILGGQGINMVLVGVRTSAAFVEPMTVRLAIEIEGEVHSRTTWDFQAFRDDGEGWRSIYNLFIALDGCKLIPEGTAAIFVVSATDAFGNTYERRIPVIMGANDRCIG